MQGKLQFPVAAEVFPGGVCIYMPFAGPMKYQALLLAASGFWYSQNDAG